jgi:hypothetical protein
MAVASVEPPSKAQESFVDVPSATKIFHKRGAVGDN